jgi:hypothetical protein
MLVVVVMLMVAMMMMMAKKERKNSSLLLFHPIMSLNWSFSARASPRCFNASQRVFPSKKSLKPKHKEKENLFLTDRNSQSTPEFVTFDWMAP